MSPGASMASSGTGITSAGARISRPGANLFAFTVDFEDWHHGIPLPPEKRAACAPRLEESGGRLLDLLARAGVRATFFLLGPAVAAHPTLVRRIAAAGHEIGCHGWSHEPVYAMLPARFREETRRCRDLVQDATGRSPAAYRAAYFSITQRSLWALEILAELGFRCDSSVFPVRNWRYGIPGFDETPRILETASGRIAEFPLPVTRMFGRMLPSSGGAYFRLYPYALTRRNLRARLAEGRPTVFYIHPWEIDPDHPRVRFPWKARLTHYAKLAGTDRKLARLLADFTFRPLEEVLAECLPAS